VCHFCSITILGLKPRLKPNQAQARPNYGLRVGLEYWQARALSPSWAWHITTLQMTWAAWQVAYYREAVVMHQVNYIYIMWQSLYA
jgi:hypothetical protein